MITRYRLFLLAGLPAVFGCSNDTQAPPAPAVTCGPDTMLVGNACQPAATACGSNLALTGGKCEPTSSICQATGTVFDSATNSCKKPSSGTLVMSANFVHGFQHIFYQAPDGDGGTVLHAIGNFTMQTANIPDSTVILNKRAMPIGGGLYTTRYPVGPLIQTPTMLDATHQLTLGEWKACNGSVSWYKPTGGRENGKAYYDMVVDVAGCTPNTLYTVWLFWTPDGTRAGATLFGPPGGIPNAFVTDDGGAGHWERKIDSELWLKSGIPMPHVGYSTTSNPTVPDISANPAAGVIAVLINHISQQSNGNAGYCEPVSASDPTCATPQPMVLNLGANAIDSFHHMLHEPGVPLSMLQPYP